MSLILGVLGSGRGTNLQSILDAIAGGRLDARVACVMSDVPGAMILARARKAGIAAEHIDCAPFRTKLDGVAEQAVIDEFRRRHVNLVVLAGFMRIVKGGLLAAFPDRVLNIHPSLLPAFPGLEAWRQAVEYGAKVSGCTVHLVDAGMDTGPILLQKTVPVLSTDTPDSLHARIQEQEHVAYPEALQLMADGRVTVAGRRVVIREQ
jgi:phosphoribosylglycinamide formyltransferase-1